MKVVGVIPARWGSTRFPGKSLADLCGKPLVQWVYENASKAERLDQLIVATDDDRIMSAVTQFGGDAVMTRNDHVSGTDRVAEAVADTAAEVVVNIQGDEPLVSWELIDRLADVMLWETQWDIATPAARITEPADLADPSVVKVVRAGDGTALYFSRSRIPYDRDDPDGFDEMLYWRHIGVYAYRRTFLERMVATEPSRLETAERLEQLRALGMGARIKVVATTRTPAGVDTPEDLARMKKIVGDLMKDNA